MMRLESWLARRMLLSRKKVGLISWSGIISILGVAVGCFALIISVAIQTGLNGKFVIKWWVLNLI